MSSLLDRLYASQANRRLFFGQGWGNLALLQEAVEKGSPLIQSDPPDAPDIVWQWRLGKNGAVVSRGSFRSPFHAPGYPPESHTAYIELIMPSEAGKDTPVCLHFAATGDEGFDRRRIALAMPLVKQGIGSLILENPYYGKRRPPDQHGKMLNRFSDLCLMGAATLHEGRSLMAWLRKEGCRFIGVCGISMGGHMAAQAGALSSEPVAIIPFIAPHSPSAVFTEGVLKNYCDWDIMNRQLNGSGDAVAFMRKILDLLDIRKFPVPRKPAAACITGALNDAYIPPSSVATLHDFWPGSQLDWLSGGHVGAFLFHRGDFVRAVIRAFDRL